VRSYHPGLREPERLGANNLRPPDYKNHVEIEPAQKLDGILVVDISYLIKRDIKRAANRIVIGRAASACR
jgi:hypothetical protein